MNYSYDEEKLTSPFTSWIFFTFLGVFNWVLFYCVGIEIKSKRYIYLGYFYFIISMLFIFSISFNMPGLGAFIFFISILGYFGGIIFSFLSLSYYKKRINLLGKLSASDLLSNNINNLNNLELESLVDSKNYTYENHNNSKYHTMKSVGSPFITIWIVLSYLGIFNCILFYYAGMESKDKKYLRIGHFFLILGILFVPCILSNIQPLSVFIVLISFMGQLFGVIYSYMIQNSYRKRINLLNRLSISEQINNNIKNLNNLELEVLVDNLNINKNKSEKNSTKSSSFEEKYKDTFADNTNNEATKSSNINEQKSTPQNNDIKESNESFDNSKTKKININSATENELLSLTEITPELAKKIISIRNTVNGFKSMDEFELLTGIKPHISIRLKDKIIFDKDEKQTSNTPNNEKKERILDI